MDDALKELETQLLAENNNDKSKQIISLFNLNFAKKNALRLDTISSLLDDVLEKVKTRLELRPNEFSNKDLIDYLNALYQAAEKSTKLSDTAESTPLITLNQQNNVVVNTANTLSRESRQRISDAVSEILNNINSKEIQDGEADSNSGESSDTQG